MGLGTNWELPTDVPDIKHCGLYYISKNSKCEEYNSVCQILHKNVNRNGHKERVPKLYSHNNGKGVEMNNCSWFIGGFVTRIH